jgi:hypothetical protein
MKTTRGARTNRRRFLRGAGGAMLALPLFASLTGRGNAAPPAPPKRIVFFYLPQNETADFMPSGSGTSFSLSGTYLEALQPFKEKLVVYHNLRGTSGHNEGHSECLTGFPNVYPEWKPTQGPSIDQLIAGRLAGQTPLPSLEMSVAATRYSSTDGGTISWTASGLSVPPVNDPRAAFERVFGPVGPEPDDPDDPAEVRRRTLSLSLLDALIDDCRSLQRELSAEERRLLDAHLSLFRDQERRIKTAVPLSCDDPGNPPPVTHLEEWDPGHWPTKVREFMDITVSAFRCDATRVATLLFGMSGDSTALPWAGFDEDFHTIAHRDTSAWREGHFQVRTWQMEQIAYFLGQLDSTPDGDGTLLDNTVVCCLPELGYLASGAGDNSHHRDNVAGVLIGGCGGYLKTGQLVDLGQQRYANLLLTLVHAMGYEDTSSVGVAGNKVLTRLVSG